MDFRQAVEFGERPAQHSVDLGVDIEVEALEERVVGQSPSLIAGRDVQGLRIMGEREGSADGVSAAQQVVLRDVQLLLEALAIGSDLAKAFPRALGCERPVLHEVEEVLLSKREALQLLLHVLVDLPCTLLLVRQQI